MRREYRGARNWRTKSVRFGQLIDAAIAAGAGGDFLGEGARFGGAVAEDFFDVVEVGGEFGAFGAGGGEVIPVIFEKGFFQIAVAEAAGAEAIFEIFGDVFGSDEF